MRVALLCDYNEITIIIISIIIVFILHSTSTGLVVIPIVIVQSCKLLCLAASRILQLYQLLCFVTICFRANNQGGDSFQNGDSVQCGCGIDAK